MLKYPLASSYLYCNFLINYAYLMFPEVRNPLAVLPGSQIFQHLVHFQEYVATVLCYSTDISNQLMVFFTCRPEVMMDDSNSREPADWRLCILCQESNTSKGAVSCSESQDRILPENTWRGGGASQCTWWAICCNSKTSPRIHQRNARWQKVTWRRSCYSYATNQTELQRVRDRFEHSVATGLYSYEKARP